MKADASIRALYTELGSPELTNFRATDLPADKPRAAGAFVLADRDGEVVLIRRKPIKGHPGIEDLWWFPGGAHELGETLQDTARREFYEETGLDVAIDRFLMATSGDLDFIAVVFRGSVVGGEPTTQVDPDATTAEVKLFPAKHIPVKMLWGETQEACLAYEGILDSPVKPLLRKAGLRITDGKHNKTNGE